jgi:uncharacterized protein (TIGR00266 family)
MTIPDLPAVREVTGESRSGIKYRIMGTIQQTLAVDLAPGQVIYSEAGAMSWMSAEISMDTHSGGGVGNMFKRAISGASMFVIDFTAAPGSGQVAFATDFPGKILAFELDRDQSVLMHKHAFICAEKSVGLDIAFTKKFGAGLFGGAGFVLQRLTGPGMVFAELDGDAIEYNLRAGQKLRIEPGHIAMLESSIAFDIEMIKGLANILAGGEGLFLATLTGPGRIWLHSMTVSKIAERLAISARK